MSSGGTAGPKTRRRTYDDWGKEVPSRKKKVLTRTRALASDRSEDWRVKDVRQFDEPEPRISDAEDKPIVASETAGVLLWNSFLPSAPYDPARFAGRLIGSAKKLLGLDLSGAPVEYQVFQQNLRYALGSYVIADGEWCSWREDADLGVVVKREPWSLVGTGETLQAALADYREEAKSLARLMQHDAAADLTDEARRMRDTLTQRYLLTHD